MFMKNHHEKGALLYNEWKQILEQTKNNNKKMKEKSLDRKPFLAV